MAARVWRTEDNRPFLSVVPLLTMPNWEDESEWAAANPSLGEILDIDGDCGGFNLQWAWSSGYVAGLHSAQT